MSLSETHARIYRRCSPARCLVCGTIDVDARYESEQVRARRRRVWLNHFEKRSGMPGEQMSKLFLRRSPVPPRLLLVDELAAGLNPTELETGDCSQARGGAPPGPGTPRRAPRRACVPGSWREDARHRQGAGRQPAASRRGRARRRDCRPSLRGKWCACWDGSAKRNLALFIAEQNVRFLALADRVYTLEAGRTGFSGTVAARHENDALRRAYFGLK